MKIAFLTSEYPANKFGASGGIGTSIVALCKGLLSTGHTPVVLLYNQPADEVVVHEGITFYCIKNVKVKWLSWWLTRKKIEKLINVLFEKRVIDLIEAPDWTGITSFIQPKRCPIIIRLHGSDTYFCHLDNRPVKLWNKFHEKRALKKADGHISVSEFTAKLTNKLFDLGIDFKIIPNSVNVKDFNNSNNSTEPSIILYFGTLIRKKGLLELPLIFNKVVSNHPDSKLILIGRDAPDIISNKSSTWKIMEELFSKQAFERVEFRGSISHDKVQQYIDLATVCVFPSFAEALPVSWLEAMTKGKAIVASNIGWASDVIDDGINGFLVHPKNHNEYAEKISVLLSNPILREEFGVSAKEKVVRKFNISVVIQQNLDFYMKTIKSK